MTAGPTDYDRVRVAIVGGGLAGLTAATALCRFPLRIELFEARRRLGGRATSFDDPCSGQMIDHGQHVALGACVALADLLHRAGLADGFQRSPCVNFVGADGRHHILRALSWLPAPWHLLGGLMRLKLLSLRDRWDIARTVWRWARACEELLCSDETAAAWLARQRQSPQAIARFWAPLLTSALGELLDRVSAHAGAFVCRHGLLASPRAHELFIPTRPLAELFDLRLAQWLNKQGVIIGRGRRIAMIEGRDGRATELRGADGTRHPFDFVVLAVPWWQAWRVLAPPLRAMLPEVEGASRLPAAPITAIHLWFDRQITPLAHAALVGRTSQWLFRPPFGSRPDEHYCQVVISASHGLRGAAHAGLTEHVCQELRTAFAAAQTARLLRSRVVTEPNAVFALRPGAGRLRPLHPTAVPNLVLAGDWTATGWPSTMESAVRSGFAAAKAILDRLGWHRPP